MDGAPRTVFVCNGGAEERHDAVTGILIDRTLEPMHLGGDELAAAIDEAVHVLGIQSLGELREARDVGEKNRDLPALTLECGTREDDFLREVLGSVGTGGGV